jgi:hypothetical protein
VNDPAADEVARREDLAVAARELKAEVAELRAEVSNLNTRTQRAERATFRSLVVIGVLMLIVVGGGVVGYQTTQLAQRVETITQRSLCPLYALVLGSYAPETRELNPDGSYEGSARQKYVNNFEGPGGLFSQRAGLPCIGPLTPPRSDG